MKADIFTGPYMRVERSSIEIGVQALQDMLAPRTGLLCASFKKHLSEYHDADRSQMALATTHGSATFREKDRRSVVRDPNRL